jgi:hypothetical protein
MKIRNAKEVIIIPAVSNANMSVSVKCKFNRMEVRIDISSADKLSSQKKRSVEDEMRE